jgi:periplasmic divalent cation tolerance protein
MKESAVIIQTTTNDQATASKIASILLDAKKVACIQLENIESYFWWEGKVQSSKELRLSVKTVKSLSHEVISIIKANHNYSLPEIIEIAITDTTTEYLSWIIKETNQPVAH